MSDGEFDWGGRLRKGIGGAQRSTQDGREPSAERKAMADGEFDWGGRLRKRIGGAQRSAQDGREPSAECKGRSRLDCDTDGWSRYESRT